MVVKLLFLLLPKKLTELDKKLAELEKKLAELKKNLAELEKKLREHWLRCSANKSSFTFRYVIDIMRMVASTMTPPFVCDDVLFINANYPSMRTHVKVVNPWVIGVVVLSAACLL